MVHLKDNITKHWWKIKGTSKHDHEPTWLVDWWTPSMVVGVEKFKQIKQQDTSMIQAGFEHRQPNKHYEFGGGRKTHSPGKVRLL